MARIFIESFEGQNFDLWDLVHNSSYCSVVSTAGLSLKGNYCTYIANDDYYIEKNVPAKTEYYFSFLFHLYDSYTISPLRLYNGGSLLVRSIFSNDKLEWLFGGVWFCYGESAINYALNTTYFMQIYIKIATTNARVVVKADGVVDRDSTSTSSISSSTNRIRFCGKAYYDNIIIDDAFQPEETEIALFKINGAGHYSDFVPTPSGNNYTCVDEVPYNDSDFVSSGIVNAIDTYTLEDMPNVKSVKCVQMHARARKDSDSPLTKFNFVMRGDSTDYHGSDISLSNTFSPYSEMRLDGPTGSGIWRQSNIDSLEIGVRTRT